MYSRWEKSSCLFKLSARCTERPLRTTRRRRSAPAVARSRRRCTANSSGRWHGLIGDRNIEARGQPILSRMKVVRRQGDLLEIVLALRSAAASRTFCTAGNNRPIRIAMMAITTKSSMSVNAPLRPRSSRHDQSLVRKSDEVAGPVRKSVALDREGRPQDGAFPHTDNKHNPRTDQLPAANRIINEISWMARRQAGRQLAQIEASKKQIRRGPSPRGSSRGKYVVGSVGSLIQDVTGYRHRQPPSESSRKSMVSFKAEPNRRPCITQDAGMEERLRLDSSRYRQSGIDVKVRRDSRQPLQGRLEDSISWHGGDRRA